MIDMIPGNIDGEETPLNNTFLNNKKGLIFAWND